MKATTPISLSDRFVRVAFNRHEWKATAKDDTAARKVEDEAQAKRGTTKVIKKLLDCEELNLIIKSSAFLYNNVYLKKTLPWEDKGYRLLPASIAYEFMQEMGEGINDITRKLVPAFRDVYLERWEQARFTLGALFDERQYPDPTTIPERFTYDLHVEPLASSDMLKKFPALAEAETSAREAEQARMQVAMADAWRKLAEPVEAMVTKLTAAEAGDAKRWHASLVTNLDSMLEVIDHLNVTGDKQLNLLAEQVRDQLQGYTLTDLRDDPPLRFLVLRNAKEIAAKMADYV